MRLLEWLGFFAPIIAIAFGTLARQEKLTLEVDETDDSKSKITFEPATVQALKQPHSLDDLLQREEWRDELKSLDSITSAFKDSTDQFNDVERLNAEEIVKKNDPKCANLPALLDEDKTLPIYPDTLCNSFNCISSCPIEFIKQLEEEYADLDLFDLSEPFCDEYVGSTDADDEIVQSVSNGQKRIQMIDTHSCKHNGLLITALKDRYNPEETLHYTALYWLNHNEPGYAIYCLQNLIRTSRNVNRIKDSQFLIAQLYYHAKRYKTSIQLLTRLAEAPPPSAIVYRVLASRLLYTDNCSTALQFYEAASKLDTDLLKDQSFMIEWDFCRCRTQVINLLGTEQKKLQRQLDELNAYNDAMERELQLHSLINSKTISKQRFSDSWLAFTHVKFGPLPGLKCHDTQNSRNHKRLQCKIYNLLDYFDATVKKLEDYRLSLESLDEHEDFLAIYDDHRKKREAEIASEMDQFLENLRPYVGLKLEEPVFESKSNDIMFHSTFDGWKRVEDLQNICSMRLSKSNPDLFEFIFLSPAKRGYPVEDLLNKYLNLQPNENHPLPWEMPYCQPLQLKNFNESPLNTTIAKFKSIVALWERLDLYSAESELIPHLAKMMGLESSNDFLLADFGQRVRTLMQFKIGPDWLHRELAAFFFRAMGLFREAFECIAQSMHTSNFLEQHYKDITFSQLVGIMRKAQLEEARMQSMGLLFTLSTFNSQFMDPTISFVLAMDMKSDVMRFPLLWQSFDIDNSYKPTLQALSEHYCNRKLKLADPIQNRFQPICCWSTEHDIYCFKNLKEEGACFKIDTIVIDDRVEHRFNSFRCSGAYVARSFAPPIIALLSVGFIRPAVEIREKLVREKIDAFLQAERDQKRKEAKQNAKKLIPLDYGGFTAQKIAQFSQQSEDNTLKIETKLYIDRDYRLKVNEPKMKLKSDTATWEKSEKLKEKLDAQRKVEEEIPMIAVKLWNGDEIGLDEEAMDEYLLKNRVLETNRGNFFFMNNVDDVDMGKWEEIIKLDWPRLNKTSIPQADPKLVEKGMQIYQVPNPKELGNFCAKHGLKQLLEPVSTYLSISVKGVNIESLIDREAKISANRSLKKPFCVQNKKNKKMELFHLLPGSKFREKIQIYKPEKALRDALLSMGNPQDTVDMIGDRLAIAMKKLGNIEGIKKGDGPYWSLATASALYFRVKGDASNAITCLIQSLDYAPRHMEDVASISLANIYHQAGFLHSALISGHYALQASGGSIVGVHFTIANIYASMGENKLAEQFYFSTLALQSNFQAAKDRIQALKCLSK